MHSLFPQVSTGDAGIEWYETKNASYGSADFTTKTNVLMSDVCLMTFGNSGDLYAIAVYFVGGTTNTYYCEVYKWNGTNTFVSQVRHTLGTGTFQSTLHIDSDDKNYAIVWDQGAHIKISTGDFYGLHNSGNPVTISYFADRSPDVAMMSDGSTEC